MCRRDIKINEGRSIDVFINNKFAFSAGSVIVSPVFVVAAYSMLALLKRRALQVAARWA